MRLIDNRSILIVGPVEILFTRGGTQSKPIAIYDGEVFFPDYGGVTRTVMKQLNKFHPDVPRTRVSEKDFSWYISSAMMRQLRTLLRRTDDDSTANA